VDEEIDQGQGSAASIIKVASGADSVGVGDLDAVIELAAKKPAEAPPDGTIAALPSTM